MYESMSCVNASTQLLRGMNLRNGIGKNFYLPF